MNEKVYEIAVDVADLAYPLQIEREIRLRSRLVAVCGKKAMRMAFTIEGEKGMQDVLVAVSKHGLSVAELTGLRELEGKEYDNSNQFFCRY